MADLNYYKSEIRDSALLHSGFRTCLNKRIDEMDRLAMMWRAYFEYRMASILLAPKHVIPLTPPPSFTLHCDQELQPNMHSNKMQERLNAQGGVIVDRDAQPTTTDRDDSLFASSISAQVAPKPLSTNGKLPTFLGSPHYCLISSLVGCQEWCTPF